MRTEGQPPKAGARNATFPASGQLEFIEIDRSVSLSRNVKGNLYVIMMTDRFNKVTRVILLGTTTVPHAAKRVLQVVEPRYVFTENGSRITLKLFATIRTMVVDKQLTAMAYNLLTNRQAERRNHMIFSKLQHYTAKNHRGLVEFVQPLAHAYNTEVHKSTRTSPLSSVLSRHRPRPTRSIQRVGHERHRSSSTREISDVV